MCGVQFTVLSGYENTVTVATPETRSSNTKCQLYNTISVIKTKQDKRHTMEMWPPLQALSPGLLLSHSSAVIFMSKATPGPGSWHPHAKGLFAL